MRTILNTTTTTVVAGLLLATQFAQPSYGQAPRTQPPRTQPRTQAPPQQTSRQSAGAARSPVAVVDISNIFKNHDRFKESMERMKVEVQKIEQQLKARHQEIDSLRTQLGQFRPGTVDYKKTEADIAKKQAGLQADTQLKRKELLEQEAKVYYDIYMEVAAEIKAFANSYGIGLVLRFSGDEIDPANRASVLQGVNRPVVYHRNLDITYDILDRLKRKSPPRSAQAAPARTTTPPPRRR